jgi:tRNA (guanine-N7-)-methyltransferase
MWITFPDPRPRKRDIKRRLTNPRFLDMYKRIVRPGGYIRLKTDNTQLYEYTLEELLLRTDIQDLKDIKTRYEEEFTAKGERIKYLRFHF